LLPPVLDADGDNERYQNEETGLSDHAYLSRLNLCQRRVFSVYCGFDSVGWSGAAGAGGVTALG
jgi:hypothetical protein